MDRVDFVRVPEQFLGLCLFPRGLSIDLSIVLVVACFMLVFCGSIGSMRKDTN